MLRKACVPLLTAAIILLCATALPAATLSVSAADYGAKGDGKTDDTAAIQKALDAVAEAKGIVHLPAGDYKISDSLRVPHRATLMGEGERWQNMVTKLVVPEPGFPAVRLSHGSGVKALTITYPNNMDNQNPEPYPPAIQLEGINPTVESIYFNGAWIGVSTMPGGCNAGQGMFRDLSGFVHHIGIHISGALDINRIENVHWFVGGTGDFNTSYFHKNRVGFQFGDVDGVMMDRCFMIRGKTFLHQLDLQDTPDNKPTPAHSLTFQVDECWMENVDNGFIFEGYLGLVLNNTHILVKDGGTGIIIKPRSIFYNGVISSVQVRSYRGANVGLEYETTEMHPWNHLTISDSQFLNGAPPIHLKSNARRVNIHDCHLRAMEGMPGVLVDPGVDFFTITNNIVYAKEAVRDLAGKDAHRTISGNLVEN